MPAGQPAKYQTPEELTKKIKEYFAECKETGEPLMTTSLAYHLGFASRQSLYDYKAMGKFSYIIKRALLFIEMSAEKNLIDHGGAAEIFRLKNFGWSDKTEVDNTHNFVGNPQIKFGDTSK